MNTTAPTAKRDYSFFRMVAAPAPAEPTPTAEEVEQIFQDLVSRGLAIVRRQPDGKNRYFATPLAYRVSLT